MYCHIIITMKWLYDLCWWIYKDAEWWTGADLGGAPNRRKTLEGQLRKNEPRGF